MNRITQYELMGQDLVTAIVSLLFTVGILFNDFQKLQIKIIYLGYITYFFYIYAYFGFGGISSVFYLLYLAIMGVSLFLFFIILFTILKNGSVFTVTKRYPRKTISGYLFFSISIVTVIEIMDLAEMTILRHEALNPFHVFYVLDLSIIFPLILFIAYLNLKRKAWGSFLSGVALVKIITILPAVIFNDVFHRIFTGAFLDIGFSILASVITVTGIILLILYLKSTAEVKHLQNHQ